MIPCNMMEGQGPQHETPIAFLHSLACSHDSLIMLCASSGEPSSRERRGLTDLQAHGLLMFAQAEERCRQQAAQEQAALARAEAAAREHQQQQAVQERARAQAEERQEHQALRQQQAWAEAEECCRQESLQEQRAQAEAEELWRQEALCEEKIKAARLRWTS